ncbi:CoA-transferase [Microbacterium sulfonylureivorans]|uniref:CoA-transferase n=1 Tax=Microbacterium sulfonylureivorans TaxID=2486854 RepID=UPI000FDA748F|nr:CoA-transferase [Microbacterium sulfonylureivorans]
MTEFVDVDGLAARVRSNTAVAVGGAAFSRLPLALIHAVVRRRPTGLHYVAWGGGLPLEMFLEAQAVRKLSFCFSSLDIFGLAPRFRAALESGDVEVIEWTALGMLQAFRAAGERLPSATLQVPYGATVGPQLVMPDLLTGEEIAVVPPLPVDTLLLHATRADSDGNIEIQGARGLDLAMIPAARDVLVTVERVVPRGQLGAPGAAVISRHQISAIAEVPGGAFPTSCLPYYAADYRTIGTLAEAPLREAFDRDRFALFEAAARLTIDDVEAALPASADAPMDGATVAEVMMSWLADAYEPGAVCSAGAVSPLALGSYLLAQRTHTPPTTIFTTAGGYVDIAPRPLLLGLGEVLDFASAPLHSGGDDTYHVMYQTGRVDYEVVNVAQLDETAATNNLWVTSPSGRRIRLPGQGGMADVADMHANFVLYQTRQSPLSMVDTVPRASAARKRHGAVERVAAGYRPGRTLVITNLAVFDRDDVTGRLRAVSLHPGVTAAELQDETGFPVQAEGLPETATPDAATLRILREQVDPLGVRDLEFTAAKDRAATLERVVSAEDRLIETAMRLAAAQRIGRRDE